MASANCAQRVLVAQSVLIIIRRYVEPFRSVAVYGAETWTLRAVEQKHLECFEMWCWRRMEKISWTEKVRSEEVLLKSQGAEKYPA
jgi:hypothetical protein